MGSYITGRRFEGLLFWQVWTLWQCAVWWCGAVVVCYVCGAVLGTLRSLRSGCALGRVPSVVLIVYSMTPMTSVFSGPDMFVVLQPHVQVQCATLKRCCGTVVYKPPAVQKQCISSN